MGEIEKRNNSIWRLVRQILLLTIGASLMIIDGAVEACPSLTYLMASGAGAPQASALSDQILQILSLKVSFYIPTRHRLFVHEFRFPI